MSAPSEKDRGSEQTKPLIIGLGEEFHPYALLRKPYLGFPPDDVRAHLQPTVAKVSLHSEVLPDLDFEIITMASGDKDGKNEIIIQTSIAQALQLRLIHKTGRPSGAFPSHQPYGFNEEILPLVRQLRFNFINSTGEVEAKPNEEALHRNGQIQFNFIAAKKDFTEDLKAKFNLEDPEKGRPGTVKRDEESTLGFSFESTATSLYIPRESWDDPTVREYVEFMNRIQQLGMELSISSSQRWNRFSGTGKELGNFRTGKPEKLAQLRELFGAPDMTLTLANRYDATELLMRVAQWILREGFNPPPSDFKGYMRNKLNAALNRFGLEVINIPKSDKIK